MSALPAKSTCLEYALQYRKSWSWSVVPMHIVLRDGTCPCTSSGCQSPGKHPRLSSWVEFQKRLPTEEEIRNWWRTLWPDAGIAVVCGEISGGFVALDVDNAETASRLIEEGLSTRAERTPRNGLHAFVKAATATKTAVLVHGIAELKGEGSLITVAPSPGYKLLQKGPPMAIEDAREWAAKVLGKAGVVLEQSRGSSKPYEVLREKTLTEGGRNNVLTSLAGVFQSKGFDPAITDTVLNAVNRERCDPPLPEEEVARIAQSVSRYPAGGKYDSAKLIDISATERKSITLAELVKAEPEHVSWFWKGFVGRGITTLISAHPKLGKTTLLFHLLKALTGQGFFLNLPIEPAKVLLLSEEPRQRIASRARLMGIQSDKISVISRFDVQKWEHSLVQIKKEIIEYKVDVIVVDTLASFWNVGDENEAARVIESLRLLQDIAQEYKVGILLFHHVRKAPGSEGTAHRGSGALLGAVDIGVEVKRVPNKKRRRYLLSLSRYEETPEDMIIELRDDGYHCLGSRAQAGYQEVKTRAFEALPGPKEQFIRRNDLQKKLNPPPSHSLLKKVLNDLVDEGWVEVQGRGRRSSAFAYRRKEDIPSPQKPGLQPKKGA